MSNVHTIVIAISKPNEICERLFKAATSRNTQIKIIITKKDNKI